MCIRDSPEAWAEDALCLPQSRNRFRRMLYLGLTDANRVMRKIIGDPYVSELDQFVSKALSEAGVMQALTALASPEKRRFLDDQANIWNHGPAGQMSVDDIRGLGITDD